jgi:hypothetical protein
MGRVIRARANDLGDKVAKLSDSERGLAEGKRNP